MQATPTDPPQCQASQTDKQNLPQNQDLCTRRATKAVHIGGIVNMQLKMCAEHARETKTIFKNCSIQELYPNPIHPEATE